MARHHRRHHARRGSGNLIQGVSNTTLAIGAAAAYFVFLRPRQGLAGYEGSAGSRTIGPGLGAWGRPVLPSAGLGWFDGFRGGLGAFDAVHGFWPAHLHGGLGALVHALRAPVVVRNLDLFAGGEHPSLGSVHADTFTHLFAGNAGSPGLGRFNNVSINRRWWT